MQAYCVKCRAARQIINPENITMKNGTPATQGICPACGTRIFRMGKREISGRGESGRMQFKVTSPIVRYQNNPIISPREGSSWESEQTFNTGAILLEGKIHFLYRAIGDDGISRIGYASSRDGFTIEKRLDYPVYQHPAVSPGFVMYCYASGGSSGGCEDPRIMRVDNEDVLYMTYTACDNGLRVGLSSIKINDFLDGKWEWAPACLISPPGEVHKNWVIFPEKIKGKYAILHSITPQILIAYVDSLDFKSSACLPSHYDRGTGIGRDNLWDSMIRGVGAPPIKTAKGWLLFYHAVDIYEPNKYKIGALLLDLEDPTRVIRCSSSPVLEPVMIYENSGFKPGIVYLSGAVVRDGKLLLYYGASDSYVCAASCDLEEFLLHLMKEGRSVLIKTQTPAVPVKKKQTVPRTKRVTPLSKRAKRK